MSMKLPPLGHDKGIENKAYHTPETVQNALTCNHAFTFNGSRSIECKKCGWGLQINSLEEYEKISDYYGRRNADN